MPLPYCSTMKKRQRSICILFQSCFLYRTCNYNMDVCGYMCATVPISTRMTTTTTAGTYDDDPEHPHANTNNKPPTNRNRIRYIPKGRNYGIQG
mmetsp:Transcript_60399/g.68443  ORF Transcript_60399/g.68443 Transcript_60399/m.68443 type:complete len:94 (+) Transcript_60399:2-283(+)